MAVNRSFWTGKRVFLTGHTGFKGGWLTLWLSEMGAKIYGYALKPPTKPNFFYATKLENYLTGHEIGDLRNTEKLTTSVCSIKPEIIFHLAAQPIVRQSYIDPVETYSVNVLGTVNLFQAVRKAGSVKAIVNVTSDKCYENREWVWPYRENEPMGGFDPYSSSKACSELLTAAYRRSFFHQQGIQVASARAGNVIGGGDWAIDRLIPDFFRAFEAGHRLTVRSPYSIRPWQHVLEPLCGYIILAEALYNDCQDMAEGWNFGPDEDDARSVSWIVDYLGRKYPDTSWVYDTTHQPHEAAVLKLDTSKAKSKLKWYPRWNLTQALDMTSDWYLAWKNNQNMHRASLQQIQTYEASLARHDDAAY